jgi:hypothetical protein
MSHWFCPNCQKFLGEKEHYTKWYESPYPATPGPFIAGHVMNNPNLPIVGVQLNQPSGFYWQYCSKCNMAAHKKDTKEDEESRRMLIIIIVTVIVCIGGFILYVYLSS